MSEELLLTTEVVGPLQVNCYIVACPQTLKALVIDPGEEGEKILAAVRQQGWQVEAVVNTHGHFDHVGANRAVHAATGCQLLIHGDDLPFLERAATHAQIYGLQTTPAPPPTRLLEDGERIACGTLEAEVIHVPGHSPGGIALRIGSHLFVGDILFADSIGRTDLPGGNHQQLVAGIRSRLWPLPAATIVHPGHGPDTSIGRERRDNPYVGGLKD